MKSSPDPDDDAGVRMFADLLAVAHEARPEALADDIIDATPSAARAIAEHPGSAFAIRCALEGYWRGGGLRYGFARKMSAGCPMTPTIEARLSACCDLAALLAVLCLLLSGLAFAQHGAMTTAKERAARCEVGR